MDRRTSQLAKRAGQMLVVLVVGSLLLGHVLGQPLLLGYVESDSMAPTLESDDGFIALPPALAGPPERGDIVVYRAEHLDGGGLTTHRVIDRTDQGYVTKGDANPFSDQAGPESPVMPEQIEAVALRLGGNVVEIPNAGTVVTGTRDVLAAVQVRLAMLFGSRRLLGTQGLGYLFFAVAVGLYGLDAWRKRGRVREGRRRTRETGTNLHTVVALSALLVVAGGTLAMSGGGVEQFDVVSVESESPRLDVIKQGTNESVPYNVTNRGLLPEVVLFESDSKGIGVEPATLTVPGGSMVNATLTLAAPPQTGYYRRSLAEHRYLAVLPEGHIRALHTLHPWLPIVAIDTLLGGTAYLLGLVLVGTGRVRWRNRDGPSRVGRVYARLAGK